MRFEWGLVFGERVSTRVYRFLMHHSLAVGCAGGLGRFLCFVSPKAPVVSVMRSLIFWFLTRFLTLKKLSAFHKSIKAGKLSFPPWFSHSLICYLQYHDFKCSRRVRHLYLRFIIDSGNWCCLSFLAVNFSLSVLRLINFSSFSGNLMYWVVLKLEGI